MADFEMERPGKPKPVVTLPRGPLQDENGVEQPPAVRIFVELAKGVAGCCFCDSPIPKGSSRFCLVVALPMATFTKTNRERRSERYYAHTGCLGGLVGNEVKRSKYTCWDCGVGPPVDLNNRFGYSFHPHSVFTTSKFAAARLCAVCARKPKWRQCCGCHVFFPQWMVSEIVDDLAERLRRWREDPFGTTEEETGGILLYDRSDGGPIEVCENCAHRGKVRTKKIADAEKADFEETRRRIIEEGVFGEE